MFLTNLGVVPILVGPLQVLLALLPAILLGLGSAVVARMAARRSGRESAMSARSPVTPSRET